LEARTTREKAQRLGMMMWMQEREQKWKVSDEDDKLWGVSVTNMIPTTMKGVAQGQVG